jgi:hypothetical protein
LISLQCHVTEEAITPTSTLSKISSTGVTSRDGAVLCRPDSATDQHGKRYRQHASPDEPSSTMATTTS